jgi:hypothetical protein
MSRRIAWTIAVWAVAVTGAAGMVQSLSKTDADSLEKKIAAVVARGAATDATEASHPLRTVFMEREINAYFKFQGAQQLPVGVVNPIITILDSGRVTGVATVDLDAVRKSRERGWTDPLAYITGSVDLHATGRLRASNGKGVFELESAAIGAVPVPKMLLQEIVTFYTKTPENPGGFSLDAAFDLPQKIRQVDLQRGSAIIVQ